MRKNVKVGIGFTSIILIVISFCLTIFAINGLMTAKENEKINDKRCEYIKEYYKADKQATLIKSKVASICSESSKENTDIITSIREQVKDAKILLDVDNININYQVDINDNSYLYVELVYSCLDESFVTKKWETKGSNEQIEDEPLNLWNGTFE